MRSDERDMDIDSVGTEVAGNIHIGKRALKRSFG